MRAVLFDERVYAMITELLPKIQSLPKADKLRLMQFLVSEIAREEGVMLQPDESYPLWTPYDAFEAADTLLHLLEEEKVNYDA